MKIPDYIGVHTPFAVLCDLWDGPEDPIGAMFLREESGIKRP